jgi:hypothetical protein
MRPSGRALALVALVACGCGDSAAPILPTPTPSPSPTPLGDVLVGPRTGPTEITFLAADPPPGATITGCGPNASGCSGRVRMRFRLLSASGGPVLDAIGFLHATNKLACYRGSTGPLDLRPGVPSEIVVVFDQPDSAACAIPASIANMKVVLRARPDGRPAGVGDPVRPAALRPRLSGRRATPRWPCRPGGGAARDGGARHAPAPRRSRSRSCSPCRCRRGPRRSRRRGGGRATVRDR